MEWPMVEPGQLSVNDRVLLHLSRFATDLPLEEYPSDITQAGIAHAVGISRTHVPRAVRALIKEGFAEEVTTRVKGHERRMSVYAITPEGLRRSEAIWRDVLTTSFSVKKGDDVSSMTGAQIESVLGRKKSLAAISQLRDGLVEMEGSCRSPVRLLNRAPKVAEFYGRDSELKAMEDFIESDARVLVVLGNKGYGTSALCRRFVDDQDESDALWIPLDGTQTAGSIEQFLIDFGKKVSKEVSELSGVLSLGEAVIVFDDYFKVSDEVVEFFSSLVDSEGDLKIIVTARQETPAYNWFYRKEQVDSGRVRELRIKGLDEASAMKLLGSPSIEKDALKRIMMLTGGQPMALRLLRENDQSGLKTETKFTTEEIGYLIFLKNKKE